MQFYYGRQMPLRVLDEAELWKKQEAEHAIILSELAVDLEQGYTDHFNRWGETLDATHRHVHRFIESVTGKDHQLPPQLYEQILELLSFCLQESISFKQFCQKVINQSIVTQNNHTVKILIQHVIHTSDYFISTAQTILHDRVAN